MRGLMSGAPPPDQMTPAPAAGEAQMSQGEPASPEEQAAYDKFVSMALLHMHDEKVAPQIAQRIRQGDPVEEIAKIGSTLALTLLQKAKDAGETVPPDVILHGGAEIIDGLIEIGEAAGVPEISEEDAERAFYMAADLFREATAAGGDFDEEAARGAPPDSAARERLAQVMGAR